MTVCDAKYREEREEREVLGGVGTADEKVTDSATGVQLATVVVSAAAPPQATREGLVVKAARSAFGTSAAQKQPQPTHSGPESSTTMMNPDGPKAATQNRLPAGQIKHDLHLPRTCKRQPFATIERLTPSSGWTAMLRQRLCLMQLFGRCAVIPQNTIK